MLAVSSKGMGKPEIAAAFKRLRAGKKKK